MLETKEQKQFLIACLVLAVILAAVSFWRKSDFVYKENLHPEKNQAQFDSKTYLRYLESLKVDPKASKALFEKLFTEEDIKKEVQIALKTEQEIIQPEAPLDQTKVESNKGQQAVVDYLAKVSGAVLGFNMKTSDSNNSLFSQDGAAVDEVSGEYQKTYKKIADLNIPEETVKMHQALLSAFISYGKFLDTAKEHAEGKAGEESWPKVYRDYAAINQQMQNFNRELGNLAEKYQIADLKIAPIYVEDEPQNFGFTLIPTARAIFGFGDLSVTIGDIPRIIKDAVEEGLAAAFSQFMGSFIQKIVSKIEQNYLIANFLYYSDALISGQYVDDYLQKYVANKLDRQIIKKFIPQFNCGQNENLKPVFQAKAREYLGFDPSSVSVSDKDYYAKMTKVGDFLASEQGWRQYYEDLASQAQSEAQKSVDRELSSPGLKTPRDTIKSAINLSISGIVGVQRANLNAIMQLGISNARAFVSKFVAQLTQTLVSQFVFRGAALSGNTVGVLKEQATCVATAQLSPVLSANPNVYQPPPPPPSKEDLIEEECEKFPRGCEQLQPEAETGAP